MCTVRNAPTLIRGSEVHTTRVNTAGGNAPKRAAKPPARGVPVVVPPIPTPPR